MGARQKLGWPLALFLFRTYGSAIAKLYFTEYYTQPYTYHNASHHDSDIVQRIVPVWPYMKSPNAVDHDYDVFGHGDGDNDGDVYL